MRSAQEAGKAGDTMTPTTDPSIKWRLEPADFVQVHYMVSWTRPHIRGGIDYIEGEDTGLVYQSRQEADAALAEARTRQSDAYLVRITYEREDLRTSAQS
jgi:hypothetical protein